MADPLNPLFTNDELIAHLLQQHPTLTREQLLKEAQAYGFDLAPEEKVMDISAYELVAFIGELHGVPVSWRERPGSLSDDISELHWYPDDAQGEITVRFSKVSVEKIVMVFVNDRRSAADYALLGFAANRSIPVEGF